MTKNVLRHCQMSPEGQNCLWLRHWVGLSYCRNSPYHFEPFKIFILNSFRYSFLGCVFYLFCLLSSWFLCTVIYYIIGLCHMPWVVKVTSWGGLEFASQDLMGSPSLRVIFMLISWFGLKRNLNKIVIIWTVTVHLPFMLPIVECLSPLAPINSPQHHPSV